jgi:phosphoribosylaminoimidazole-succinocarboxamide synthase
LHFKVSKPPLKGRKNRRRSTKESDWRTYTGSSKELNADIEKLGKDKFTFTILELYDTKWELSYGETKRIVMEDAIPSRRYYNEFLGKTGKCPEKARLD